MAKQARGADWAPKGNVQFTPTPHKLIPVQGRGGMTEYVASNFDGVYDCAPFDDWRRDDPVVLEQERSSTRVNGKTETTSEWLVGVRGSTPSAARQTVRLEQGDGAAYHVNISSRDTLWRVPYRWRGAIAKLNGRRFGSKAELEAAMEVA